MTAAGDRLETGGERSTKVTAATVAGAIATIVWAVVAVAWPTAFDAAVLATLTGATATVLTYLLAWQAPENERYLRWAAEWRKAKQAPAAPAAETARLAARLDDVEELVRRTAELDLPGLKETVTRLVAEVDQIGAAV